jgi:hypothetical protein
VIWGGIVALPVEPGDEIGGRVVNYSAPGMSLEERDALIEKTFLVMIIPALLGVRSAMKEADK